MCTPTFTAAGAPTKWRRRHDPFQTVDGDRSRHNFLGQMAIQGERGLLTLPLDWLVRLRHNPFYTYMEGRVLAWIEISGTKRVGSRKLHSDHQPQDCLQMRTCS